MSWVVTGVGAVSSVGASADETFEALCAGRSGLAPLRGFNAEKFRARHAYEIDDRPADGTDVPGRATRWLVGAIEEALRDAGIDDDLADIPVLIGTGLRELRSVELWWRDGADFSEPGLHFGTALGERFNAAQTYTFCNACSASLYALALGTDLLAAGSADTVVVAGVDSITESMFGLLDRVNSDPPERVQPFDRDRKGVLMGDGATAVVLRREADVPEGTGRGRLRSVAINCDAYHVTAPDPDGIAVAINDAYDRAGVKPADIDLIMLHGTGTPLNDVGEGAAVSQVLGDQAGAPWVTAIKGMTGHTSGGSGLLGLVLAMAALRSGRIPPTVGLSDVIDEASGLRFAGPDTTGCKLNLAQVNAFGFGGVNAVAIVERTQP